MSQIPQEPEQPPHEEGVSLDSLSQAYARSMGSQGSLQSPAEPSASDAPASDAPASDAPASDASSSDTSSASDHDGRPPSEAPSPPNEALPASGAAEQQPADQPTPPPALAPLQENEPEEGVEDESCPLGPETILEAMLFVGNQANEPLTAARAAELMRGVSADEIPGMVDALTRRYAASGCPYRVVGEGSGYRLSLDSAFNSVRNRFYGRARQARLSQAAIDVLAIVAYQQPILGDTVSKLRGTPSGHVLAQLVRRQLLGVERSAENRRKMLYRTTDRFLELFGLENLSDLPDSETMDKR